MKGLLEDAAGIVVVSVVALAIFMGALALVAAAFRERPNYHRPVLWWLVRPAKYDAEVVLYTPARRSLGLRVDPYVEPALDR